MSCCIKLVETPLSEVRTRKRLRQPSKHKQAVAKALRNKGQRYVSTTSKKVINQKHFIENYNCNCSLKCSERISNNERKIVFENFWKIGNFSQQKALICGLIQQTPVMQKRPRDNSRGSKACSNKFHLKTPDKTIHVCKLMFLNTLGLSGGRTTRALMKVKAGRSPGGDLRGKRSSRKLPETQVNEVVAHIESFPSYQSHYTREHIPNRKYLSSLLDVRKMYDLYVKQCDERNLSPVKEHFYRHIFNTRFNLHFHAPHKDSCRICDKFEMIKSIETDAHKIEEAKTEHVVHLLKAEKARKCMAQDKLKAQNSPDTVYACSIDLQKALPFPILTVSVTYYKRNMYCFNLGLHELSTGLGYFYVWDETTASRGAQEISSCVTKYIRTCAAGKKSIIIYSDTCTGQNRNIKFVLALMKLIQEIESIETIDHKFLVSGHSFLPNDRDFGIIETAAKKKTIFTADDWYDAILTARRSNKFMVTKMFPKDFRSTSVLEDSVTRRKKNMDNQDVNWLQMQWIRVEKAHPYIIFYKTTLDEDFIPFSKINIKPSKDGRPPLFSNILQPQLYLNQRPVTKLKKKDMLSLLQYIPPIHHAYFKNLSTSTDDDDQGPLIEDE